MVAEIATLAFIATLHIEFINRPPSENRAENPLYKNLR